MQKRPAVLTVVGIATGIVVSTAALQAQDNAGLQADATVSFGTKYEDETWTAYSGLGFSMNSSTRIQSFGLSLSAGLETGGQDALDLVDPNLLLTYNRVGRNALFQASARYRESELGGFTIDEDSSTGELVATTGSKSDLDLSTALEFGTVSPFGGTVSLGWRDVTYSGATTLADFETHKASVALRFTIDPRIDLRTTASYQETLSDTPGTDRKTQSLGLGADIAVSEIMRLSLDLGYSEIETRPAGGPVQTDTGPTFGFRAERDMRDGGLRFDLSSTVTNTGTRTEAMVTRTLETALGDDVLLSAGVSHGGNGELAGLWAVEYARTGQDAGISVALSRSVQGDLFGEETLRTQFRLAHEYRLSEIAGIDSALAYRETEFRDSATPDSRKLELSFGYARELTRDLDLTAEVSHTRSWSGSTGPSKENTVFLGVERAFSWRP